MAVLSGDPDPRPSSSFRHLQCITIAFLACMLLTIIVSSNPHSEPGRCLEYSDMTSAVAFNATAFWDTEKSRVEGTSINLAVLNQNRTQYNGQDYNRTDMAFDTPNWVGHVPDSLRVYATLFTPANDSGTLPLLPGVVLIHGTGQNRHDYLNVGLSYAALNCAVLVLDLVGHGESAGPKPDANHTLFQGDFNKTSYHYLAFCNGLQSIRLIRSFTSLVDSNKIAITGHSLGGMTSMVVSAIYHDKIALSLPTGMINITCTFPETSVLNLVNLTYEQYCSLPADTWKWINPLNYMNVADYPMCCPFVGTNDEYFSYEGIDDVWAALQGSSSQEWLQITPNGHHKYPTSQTPHYLLKHVFFGGPAPPNITVMRAEKLTGILEQFRIDVKISFYASIASVELCYKYKDIFGEPWRSTMMAQTGTGQWSGVIETPWITSSAACFVKVTLESAETIWFTSLVVEAGILSNMFSILPVLCIILALAIPIVIILRDRYHFEVNVVNARVRKQGRRFYIAENLVIGGTESLKFLSLNMTWINYGPTLPWSLAYIMNSYFTYEGALKEIAFYFNALLVVAFLAILVIGFANPLVSGLLNLAWPVCFYLLASMLATSLGSTISAQLLGPGYFVFLVVALAQIATWIGKRAYHKQLGIPTRSLLATMRAARSPGRKVIKQG